MNESSKCSRLKRLSASRSLVGTTRAQGDGGMLIRQRPRQQYGRFPWKPILNMGNLENTNKTWAWLQTRLYPQSLPLEAGSTKCRIAANSRRQGSADDRWWSTCQPLELCFP